MKPVHAGVSQKMYRKPDYKVAYITMVRNPLPII